MSLLKRITLAKIYFNTGKQHEYYGDNMNTNVDGKRNVKEVS